MCRRLRKKSAVPIILLSSRGEEVDRVTALRLDIVANLTRWGVHDRLMGGALGVAAGVVLFALGVAVSRHKELALARYRQVMAWPW